MLPNNWTPIEECDVELNGVLKRVVIWQGVAKCGCIFGMAQTIGPPADPTPAWREDGWAPNIYITHDCGQHRRARLPLRRWLGERLLRWLRG